MLLNRVQANQPTPSVSKLYFHPNLRLLIQPCCKQRMERLTSPVCFIFASLALPGCSLTPPLSPSPPRAVFVTMMVHLIFPSLILTLPC